jgi:hypothetical protein
MSNWERQAEIIAMKIESPETSENEVEALGNARRRAIEDIFEEYCEVGRDAARFRDAGVSWSSPSEYDADRDQITFVSEKNGIVTADVVHAAIPDFVFRYNIVRLGERWMLRDVRKRRIKEMPGWSADLL